MHYKMIPFDHDFTDLLNELKPSQDCTPDMCEADKKWELVYFYLDGGKYTVPLPGVYKLVDKLAKIGITCDSAMWVTHNNSTTRFFTNNANHGHTLMIPFTKTSMLESYHLNPNAQLIPNQFGYSEDDCTLADTVELSGPYLIESNTTIHISTKETETFSALVVHFYESSEDFFSGARRGT